MQICCHAKIGNVVDVRVYRKQLLSGRKAVGTMGEVEKFVELNRSLLAEEKKAEEQQQSLLIEGTSLKKLCQGGQAIASLKLEEITTRLYGRSVLKFSSKPAGTPLPSHKLSCGDIVGVALKSDHRKSLCRAVIYKLSDQTVSVAVDEFDSEVVSADDRTYCLVKLINDVTYRRYENVLNHLATYDSFPGGKLCDLLFNSEEIVIPHKSDPEVKVRNANLNSSQINAVQFALNESRPVAVIHGPPGTGKTTVVIEIILAAIQTGQKILVCCPSNVAVDNIVARLTNHLSPGNLVRLGHPARLVASIHKYSLDAVVKSSDDWQIIRDVRSDIDKVLAKLQNTKAAGDKRRLGGEMRSLKGELWNREQKCIKEILNGAQVVAATLTTAGHNDRPLKVIDTKNTPFDLVIIDEVAQSLELACWIALLQAKRCVLVGDHCQLPPTIVSEQAAKRGFEITLMERILKKFTGQQEHLVRLLDTQYRMNRVIMEWSSNQLYDGKIVAHTSVENHLLSGLTGVETEEDCTDQPLLLIDTAGCGMEELDTPAEMSKANLAEAKLVMCHLESLVALGVKPDDVAIISPYNLQVTVLKRALSDSYPKVQIRSIDGFQGQEREVVILSLVRSNSKKEVGFLSEIRRLNVAITRARRHLAIICDSKTVSVLPALKGLIQHMETKGLVKSAHEYEGQIATVQFNVDLSDLLDSTEDSRGKPQNAAQSQKQRKQKFEAKPKVNGVPLEKGALVSRSAENQIDNEADVFTKQIDEFMMDDTRGKLNFPTSLNSYCRRKIHEVAESLQLIHYSKGEGNNRRITLEKPKPEELLLPHNNSLPLDSVKVEQPVQVVQPLPSVVEHSQSGPASTSDETAMRVRRKRDPKKPAVEKIKAEEDVSRLLDEFAEVARKCSYGLCKQTITMLGQRCQFCAAVFCLSHNQAEIHGCGDQARAFARAEFKKQSAGQTSKPPLMKGYTPDQRRQLLQKKLDTKLNDMQSTRTAKPKPKK